MTAALIIFLLACLIACVTDAKARRIPNVLTYTAIVVALGFAATHGWAAFGQALCIVVATFLAGSVLLSFGWLGGGDIKLLAAGAATIGLHAVLPFLCYIAVAGGAFAAMTAYRDGRLRTVFTHVVQSVAARTAIVADPNARRIPYAFAIFSGTFYFAASESFAPWLAARSLNKKSTTILIAIVLAAGTGLLLFNYLSTVAHTAQAIPMRSVIVATRAIPARTVVRADMVTVADRPQDSVDSDASTSYGTVVGQMAFIDIPSGSILSSSKIGHLETGGLTMRVPAGQRAMSIALDPVKGVADLVQAGDHVDVIAVTQPRGSAEAPRVATILRNKLVLAMGTTMEVPAAGAIAGAAAAAGTSAAETAIQTATLAIGPHEASTLALADLNATLRLSLRSPRDSNRSEPGDDFVLSAPVVAHTAAAPATIAAAPVPIAPRPKAVPAGIPMIDGDQVIR